MDDLLSDFLAEAREMLESLSGEIVAWEADPADKARLDAIFRFVHTVKGNCGFFDFPHLEKLSHAAEDALSDCRAGRRQPDSRLVDAVLAIIDRIAVMVEDIAEGREATDQGHAQLIAALGTDTAGQDENCSAREAPISPANIPQDLSDPAAEAPGERKTSIQRTIRLPVDQLDRVMSGVSDMAVVRNELARKLTLEGASAGVETTFNRLSAVLSDLSEAIASIRMQRIETMFAGFPRLVRDLSNDLGKKVSVVVESGDVEIDRELIEVVRDPLVHIIRNAVDHGIETPEERRAAGKPETGSVGITARQTGSEIRIGIVDDGRGIDSDRLVEKAIAARLVTEKEAEALSPQQRNQLICESGLSTARQVTAISGRGVGMDVVRANIEKIGGTLVIDSTPGVGTRMMINIPLTLAIVPSLTVKVGGQVFALPRSYVEEIVHLKGKGVAINVAGGRNFLRLRGQDVPSIGLDEVLGLSSTVPDERKLYILIKIVGGELFGLAVDAIVDQLELVVNPVAPLLMRCGFYVGCTQLDDGRPVPMLDVAGVANAAGMIGEVKNMSVSDEALYANAAQDTSQRAMLFVAFDGEERAIEMDAVRRIEKLPADRVRRGRDGDAQIAIEDRIVTLLGLDVALDSEKLAIFSIGEGASECALAYARMIDLVSYEPENVRAGAGGERVALIGGRPTQLLGEDELCAVAVVTEKA